MMVASCSKITGVRSSYVPDAVYGIAVDILYQVLDQYGWPIFCDAMTPFETGVFYDFNQSYANDVGPSYISDTSETTASDGTFHDAPVGACGESASSNSRILQNVYILAGGNSYPVRTHTYVINGPAPLQGSITSFYDVSASH